MTYELCLEYGTYPLSLVDAALGEDQNPPEFIQDDQVLLNKLDIMNQLFMTYLQPLSRNFTTLVLTCQKRGLRFGNSTMK